MVKSGIWKPALIWGALMTVAGALALWLRPNEPPANVLTTVAARWGLLIVAPVHLTWWWLSRHARDGRAWRWFWVAVPLAAAAALCSALGVSRTTLQGLVTVGIVVQVTAMVHQALREDLARRLLTREQRRRELAQHRLLGSHLGIYLLPRLLQRLHELALADAKAVAPHVLDLAQMMRFLTTSAQRDFHPVCQEWDFLLAYRRVLGAIDPVHEHDHLRFEGDHADPLPALVLATWFEYAVRMCGSDSRALGIRVHLKTNEDGFDLTLSCPAVRTDLVGGQLPAALRALRQQLRHQYGRRPVVHAEQRGEAWILRVQAC